MAGGCRQRVGEQRRPQPVQCPEGRVVPRMRVYWPVPFEIALLETALFRTERFCRCGVLKRRNLSAGRRWRVRSIALAGELREVFRRAVPPSAAAAEGRAIGPAGPGDGQEPSRDLWLQGLSSSALCRALSRCGRSSRPGRDASKKLSRFVLAGPGVVARCRALSRCRRRGKSPSRETSKKLRDSWLQGLSSRALCSAAPLSRYRRRANWVGETSKKLRDS